MTFRWSVPAADDLRIAYEYIADEGNLDAAAALVEHLIQPGERLAACPQLGKAGRVEGTRELIITPFVLEYRISGSVVDITSVIHGSRRLH